MPSHVDAVAKIRVLVDRNGEIWSLLSRKRAEGTDRHGQLEMLGGHVEGDESPPEALIRELREEEQTGDLARFAIRGRLKFATELVDGDTHHLFELRLSAKKYAQLEFDPRESLGFVLLRTAELQSGKHRNRLTWRTKRIFEAFGPVDCLTE